MRRIAILPLLFLLTSCSSKELSRPKAADLLEESPSFAEDVLALPLQEHGRQQGKHDAGEVEGIWTITRKWGQYARFTLTPKGRELFAHDFSANELAPLVQPAKRQLLEITGITSPPMGGEGLRIASFTWQYAGLPPIVARYTGEVSATHNGEALFQLFDDGWRILKLDLHQYEGRSSFEWPPELQATLQQRLEAKQLTQDQAFNLAKAVLVDHEPTLSFLFHPAWNIPAQHGLTGQPLNREKLPAFVELLQDHGVQVNNAAASSGYYQVEALTPPGDWNSYVRKPGHKYAVFTASELTVASWNYSGLDSDDASLSVEVSYSGCSPACELARALLAVPDFEYGGKAIEKVFSGYSQRVWQDRASRTVYYKRNADESWKVSGVR